VGFLLFAFGVGLAIYGVASERDVVLMTGALLAAVAVVANSLRSRRPGPRDLREAGPESFGPLHDRPAGSRGR